MQTRLSEDRVSNGAEDGVVLGSCRIERATSMSVVLAKKIAEWQGLLNIGTAVGKILARIADMPEFPIEHGALTVFVDHQVA